MPRGESKLLALGLFVNGLYNNLGYVVMLSAAKSILPHASVAYVLLFDDTPAFFAQLLSPLLLKTVSFRARILFIMTLTMTALSMAAYCTAMASASPSGLHFPGLNRHHEMMEAHIKVIESKPAVTKFNSQDQCGYAAPLIAVALTSICFGVGESTFFSMLAVHPSSSIGYFASGTGCAGVVGAGVYFVLIWLFNAPTALLICAMSVPVHAAIFFRIVLPATEIARRDLRENLKVRSKSVAIVAEEGTVSSNFEARGNLDHSSSSPNSTSKESSSRSLCAPVWQSLKIASRLRRSILKYFTPLFIMYYITFFINHALLPHVSRELAVGDNAHKLAHIKTLNAGVVSSDNFDLLRHVEERYYVLFFFVYQCAVFMFRSSLTYIKLKRSRTLWMLNALQLSILLLFLAMTSMRHHSIETTLAEWSRAMSGANVTHIPSDNAVVDNNDGHRGILSAIFTKGLIFVCVIIEGAVSGIIYVNTFNLVRHDKLIEHAPSFQGESVGTSEEESRSIVLGLVVCATTAGPILAALTGIAVDKFL